MTRGFPVEWVLPYSLLLCVCRFGAYSWDVLPGVKRNGDVFGRLTGFVKAFNDS